MDDAEFGKRLWGPDEEFEARARRIERNAQLMGFAILGLGLAFFLQAALSAAPGGYETATGLSAVGAVLVIFAAVVIRRSAGRRSLALGVFEGGILLPSSFENVPGLETLGGPVAIRRGDIDHVEEIRRGEDRAIVVWSKGGPSGVASSRMEGPGLAGEQARALFEQFQAALVGAAYRISPGKPAPGAAAEEE